MEVSDPRRVLRRGSTEGPPAPSTNGDRCEGAPDDPNPTKYPPPFRVLGMSRQGEGPLLQEEHEKRQCVKISGPQRKELHPSDGPDVSLIFVKVTHPSVIAPENAGEYKPQT